MSIRWDASMNVDLPQGWFTSFPRPDGNAPMLGMQAESPREAMNAVDVALARQELLGAANASNPLARAIIMHVAAYVLRREPPQGMAGVPVRVPERYH